MRWSVSHSDALRELRGLPSDLFDASVTDPPYALGGREPTGDEICSYLQGGDLDVGGDFLGKEWDMPPVPLWREVFRVLKPGARLLAFGGPRTYDLLSLGIRAAGFVKRDEIYAPALAWVQSAGLPKSSALLKPCWEPVCLFVKPGPLRPLNLSPCSLPVGPSGRARAPGNFHNMHLPGCLPPACVAACPVAALDRLTGPRASGKMKAGTARANRGGYAGALPARTSRETHGDSGAVSRFFPAHEWGRYDVDPLELLPFMYEGKARGKARLDGAEGVNPHPTVKPVALIRWLWRLVAGPGVLGLDPFLGSGSHAVAALLEGLRVHGIEREAEYVELARRRLLALPSGARAAPR